MTPTINPNPVAATDTEIKNDRDIVRITYLCTAFALGCVFASNASVTHDADGFAFHVSLWTLAAFVVGVGVGLLYWKIIDLGSERKTASKFLRAASFGLLLVGIGAFLYPVRFLPTDKLPDVAKGLGVDLIAFALLAFIFWKIRNFLNADTAATELAEQQLAAARAGK